MRELGRILPGMKATLELFREMPSVGGFDVILKSLRELQAMIPTTESRGAWPLANAEMVRLQDASRESLNKLIISLLKQQAAQETEEDIRDRLKTQKEVLQGYRSTVEIWKEYEEELAKIRREQAGLTEDTDKSKAKVKTYAEQIDILTESMSKLRIAIHSVGTATANLQFPAPVGAEFLELEQFAKGGQPHGRDNVPAMLSPGEFVVNAAASRRFYSQLVRMNSGVQHFDRGGQVSNVNVGDINVNLPATTSPDYDAVRLGKMLRRGIRRGTVKL